MSVRDQTHTIAAAWLDAFEAAVRARDFAAGRALFVDDALGFGSVEPRCAGLDVLVAAQWQRVWPLIERFTFDRGELRVFGGDGVIVIATTWTSVGLAPSGERFDRPGRVTLVLRADARPAPDVTSWRCAHSHYSLHPVAPAPHD